MIDSEINFDEIIGWIKESHKIEYDPDRSATLKKAVSSIITPFNDLPAHVLVRKSC